MAGFKKIIAGILVMFCLWNASKANTRFLPTRLNAIGEEVEFTASPSKSDAIYSLNSPIVYHVEVKNGYNSLQKGTLSYSITSVDGKKVTEHSMDINLDRQSSKSFTFDIPAQPTGFYNINMMINVSDYDDTIKRVFGVNPEGIKSKYAKPVDFDSFWESTKKELSNVEPQYKVTEHPELAKGNTQVYLVEMQSLNDLTIRAWMTIAKDRKPKEKFPVWLILPGYQGSLEPVYGPRELVVFSVNIRGNGNSKDVINTTRDGWLTTGIEDKYKYVLRGALMDCLRAVDFISSRPELDSKAIVCSGGSMGAYLAIALSSIDNRVYLCNANNPVFCDYRSLSKTGWPMRDITFYAKQNSYNMESVMRNLDYFDLKNFSNGLKCKSVFAVSLLDNLAPPYNEYTMLNNIPAKNKLFIYPNLAHEVPVSLGSYISHWMFDSLGIY